MKLKRITLFLMILLPVMSYAQKTWTLEDASGKINVNIILDKDIRYQITHEGDIMIDFSPISLTLTDGRTLGEKPRLKNAKRRTVNETIHPIVYKKATIEDEYNELTLNFRGGYSVVFRAYRDGVAYRFTTNLKDSLFVANEQAVFNLPDNPQIYAATPAGRKVDGKECQYFSAFQNTYLHTPLNEWNKERLIFMPTLVERAHGKKISITEADLLNYPGMYLKTANDNKGFYGHFAPYPKDISVEVRGLKEVVKSREPYIAKVPGKTAFPWRVIAISEQDTELPASDLVYKLASPTVEGDFSWVKPGKVAWEWWNDWGVYGVDFKAGINTETYKYYIDFAARFGIEYVILDEGWAVAGPADLFQIVPEIDMEELVRYADSKGVGLILWAGYRAFNNDMERVCKHYAQMGIKGFKIDFMDRDDQQMIEFNRRCAEVGAKYKLMIDLHGTSKPTGLQRTYPNVVNFEGVFGLEEMKWAQEGTDQVTYDVTVPFIRMLAGPMDYTQGAMANANKKNFKAIYSEPMSQGTRCRQLAAYVVFDSPLNMLCDSPSNYLREEECTRFIAGIPTTWDETRVLQGKVGEYIVTARRKGDTWYVAGMTDWNARNLPLDLSFIGTKNYRIELFKDGINADRIGKDYKREELRPTADNTYNVHLAPGGGFAMKITKQ